MRRALLQAQRDLGAQKRFPVLVLIAGVEGAGKSETVHLLNEWMDPRFIEVTGFALPTEEEAAHPPMWRFWKALPPKGRIGVFFGAWQTMPILERVLGHLGAGGFAARMEEIMRLERMLAAEGVLLVKYWFHLSKAQQKKRIKALEKDRETSWKVTRYDRALFDRYDDFIEVCEPFLRETSTGEAPWTVVPAVDERYRALFVGPPSAGRDPRQAGCEGYGARGAERRGLPAARPRQHHPRPDPEAGDVAQGLRGGAGAGAGALGPRHAPQALRQDQRDRGVRGQ